MVLASKKTSQMPNSALRKHTYLTLQNIIRIIREDNIQMVFIDLFAGAGGVSEGIYQSYHNGKRCAIVCYAVNHDKLAIGSHAENHPYAFHADEDIRDFDLSHMVRVITIIRRLFPHIRICLWASLECTNFSKAKGGLARDADSRTLAWHLHRYITAINPDMVYIENVEEFMCWGPLDDNGKPLSKRNGIDYLRWVDSIKSFGYDYDWRLLNAADYGAYTSRKRFFAQFAKPGIVIQWPVPSHAKNPENTSLFGGLKKHQAVRDVLELDDHGNTVFRQNPLSDKTYERIYAGLIKYVAGMSQREFLSKYYSGRPEGKNISLDGPAGAIKCIDSHSLIKVEFIDKYYGTGGTASIDEPAPTVTTNDRFSLISSEYWIDKQYSSSYNHQSIDIPSGSITTLPKMNLVKIDPFIMSTHFNNNCSSINEPAKTITANRKYDYLINMNSSTAPAVGIDNPSPTITSVRTHYLVNPSWGGNTQSIDNPCCVVIARQDKAPLYVVAVEHGSVAIPVYDSDSAIVIKIKEFMAIYSITDIKMRMLKVSELKRIQGFPDNYTLLGNQSQQKKMLGNACEVNQIKSIIQASYHGLLFSTKKAS